MFVYLQAIFIGEVVDNTGQQITLRQIKQSVKEKDSRLIHLDEFVGVLLVDLVSGQEEKEMVNNAWQGHKDTI